VRQLRQEYGDLPLETTEVSGLSPAGQQPRESFIMRPLPLLGRGLVVQPIVPVDRLGVDYHLPSIGLPG